MNKFLLEYAGPVSNPAFSCILRFLMQFQRAPDNSKLFRGPSLFQATSSLFQAIPNVFQSIPALLQASPSISMTFAQEIFGSHFLVIFLKKSSAFLRFCASHVGAYCGARSMQISRIFGDQMARWVPSYEWSRKCSNSLIF